MANRRITELVQEALAIRARAYGLDSDSTWAGVKKRMHELKGLAATVDSNEVRRHVIVASIATLQTFVRFSISELVNSEAQYRVRAAERIPEKYSVKDALTLLDDQTISFGELVAHIASYNSVTDVVSWLGAILGLDLKSALSDARSHYMLRRGSKGAPLLIADVDQLLGDVENAFRLRHILAHEMAYGLSIETEECRRLVGAVDRFIAALNAVIWNTAYTEVPLVPEEYRERASETRCAARSELAKSLFRAREVARILRIFIMAPQQSPPLGAVRTSVGGRRTARPACGTHTRISSIWRNRHDPSTICAGSRMGHLLGRPTYASGSLAQIASQNWGALGNGAFARQANVLRDACRGSMSAM